MELVERLRETLEKEFGIRTDDELIRAVENLPELDLGIFVTSLKGVVVENAS